MPKTIELNREIIEDLERVIDTMADQYELARIGTLARAIASAVSPTHRAIIERVLAARSYPGGDVGTVATTWSAIYTDATPAPPSTETSVPGESTIVDEGGFAFEEDTIRGSIAIVDGLLDLRRWLRVVPQVHSAFATRGAEKVVAELQSTNAAADDALLDTFAREMARWARENDPALELSVIAHP